MSLINEALKRTNAGSAPAAPVPANYRVAAPAAPKARRYMGLVVLGIVVVAMIVAGGWQFLRTSPAKETPVVRVQPPPPLPPAPVVVPPPPPVVETVVVTKVVEPPPPVVVPAAPPPERPKLVLQGINSFQGKREAMINDHTYRDGDEVEGATIVAIGSRDVRLRFAGVEYVLRMN